MNHGHSKRYLGPLSVVALVLAVGPFGPARPGWAKPPQGDGQKALVSRTVTITKKMPRVGLTRVSSEENNMRFSISGGGGSLSLNATGSKKKTEKLLAVTGSTPTKVRVTFHKITKVEVQNGMTRKVPSPIAGKTYEVEATASQVAVTGPGGKAVPEAERAAVAEEYRSFGKPNFMLDGLPTDPIQIGARVPSMEEAMKKSFRESMSGKPGEQWQISDPIVTLAGQGRVAGARVAFFDFSMSMTLTQGAGFTMTMHQKGRVTVRLADGWPIQMSMKGPMDIMGKANAGQMSMTQKTQYR